MRSTLFISLTAASLGCLALAQSVSAQTADWWTVAANPQRTSWVPQQVSGNFHPVWYRPIEAYIPQNSQLITYQGKVLVSTSRGLLVFNLTDGSLYCRFDTQLPLGNSPTVVNNIAYFGGYDKKLHAIDISTNACVQRWAATVAQAGYSANPLVIDNVVYAANRDGHLYALSTTDGHLLWQYPSTGAVGSIHQSPAYLNGTIYFAANDNYGYAVYTNGSLRWKTAEKFPGDGFESYWATAYTDKASNTDYILFVGAHTYKSLYPDPNLGTDSIYQWEGIEIFGNGGVPNGIVAYHLAKPWRRVFFVVNAQSGTEYRIPGSNAYAPFTQTGTHSGTRYPPIIMPDTATTDPTDTKIVATSISGPGYIPRAGAMSWRPGSTQIQYTSADVAIDEPQALSGGGNTIYRNRMGDRGADWSGASGGFLWHGNGEGDGLTLAVVAPGYDLMWWGIDHNSDMPGLEGNYGYNGLVTLNNPPPIGWNGLYHSHGQQNPLIPYQDATKLLLLVHRGNAVLAFGTGTQATTPLPLIRVNQTQDTLPAPSMTDLTQRLSAEIQKIITAGQLRPGYYTQGQADDTYSYVFATYFDNPGDTLSVLSRAYPLLNQNPSLQSQLKTFLDTQYQTYFRNQMIVHTGWQGANREGMPIPNDLISYFNQNSQPLTQLICPWCCRWAYPPTNLYALWQYVKYLYPQNQSVINEAFNLARSKWASPGSFDQTRPWDTNGWIAGLVGYVELAKLAGNQTEASAKQTILNQQLSTRAQQFDAKSPWIISDTEPVHSGDYHRRNFNILRNFVYWTPELGDYFYQNPTHRTRLQNAVDEYNQVGPYWFASRYDAAPDEGSQSLLYNLALFQAKAYGLKQTREELYKYLDVPAFEQGDLFYIQNLVALIEAPSDGSPTATPGPSTPPPPPTYDFADLLARILSFGVFNHPINLLGTDLIDIFDINSIIQNL